jgi:hypothetical protein
MAKHQKQTRLPPGPRLAPTVLGKSLTRTLREGRRLNAQESDSVVASQEATVLPARARTRVPKEGDLLVSRLDGFDDSLLKEMSNAIDRPVDCRVGMRRGCVCADATPRCQRYGYCADDGIARPVTFFSLEGHVGASNVSSMPGESCEQAIFRIGAGLSVTAVVLGDNFDPDGFHMIGSGKHRAALR